MTELLTAFALVLVIEGVLYALFPEAMQRMMTRALELPPSTLRYGGLALALVGLVLAWIVRG
ncbi:MAG: DUF2065 domain-containing protein [Kiloniellales bacterium]